MPQFPLSFVLLRVKLHVIFGKVTPMRDPCWLMQITVLLVWLAGIHIAVTDGYHRNVSHLLIDFLVTFHEVSSLPHWLLCSLRRSPTLYNNHQRYKNNALIFPSHSLPASTSAFTNTLFTCWYFFHSSVTNRIWVPIITDKMYSLHTLRTSSAFCTARSLPLPEIRQTQIPTPKMEILEA